MVTVSVARTNEIYGLDDASKLCIFPYDFRNPEFVKAFTYRTRNIDITANPTKYIAFPQAVIVGGAVIVTYQEGDSHGSSDRTKMVKGTISGGIVTYGSPVTFYESGVYDYSLLSGLMSDGEHITLGVFTIKYTSAGSVYTPYIVSTVVDSGLTYALWSPPVAGPGGVLWRTGYAVNGSDQQSALFESADSGETWTFVKILFQAVGKKYNETAICNTTGTTWIAFCRVDGETGGPLAFLSSTDDFTTLSSISQYAVSEINGRQPALIKTTDGAIVLMTGDRLGASGFNSAGQAMTVADRTGIAMWRSTSSTFATHSPRVNLALTYSTDGGQPKPLEISANRLHVPYYARPNLSVEPGIASFTVNTGSFVAPTDLTRPAAPKFPIAEAEEEVNLGTVSSGTATFDRSLATKQRLTVGGALTVAVTNWPITGDHGHLWIRLVNGGSAAITWPAALVWMHGGSAVSTTAPRAFKTSGTDFIYLETVDAGATVYAKIYDEIGLRATNQWAVLQTFLAGAQSSGTAPYYELNETDRAADEKIARIYHTGGGLRAYFATDAGSLGSEIFAVTRTANAPTGFSVVNCPFNAMASVSAAASGGTLTTASYGKLNTNEGATGVAAFVLPTAAAGGNCDFYVQDSDGLSVTAAAGDTIRFGGTVTAAAGTITSTTVGSSISLRAINATEWVSTAIVGTWA